MKRSELREMIREEIEKLNEVRVPVGFKKFFIVKLKKTGHYDDNTEIKNEAEHAFDNMKYDMKNGDSLFGAFQKACRDLHIEPDNIESYL